ncbi:hypothetical protein ACHAWF_014715 [Thalassiosira exigua]
MNMKSAAEYADSALRGIRGPRAEWPTWLRRDMYSVAEEGDDDDDEEDEEDLADFGLEGFDRRRGGGRSRSGRRGTREEPLLLEDDDRAVDVDDLIRNPMAEPPPRRGPPRAAAEEEDDRTVDVDDLIRNPTTGEAEGGRGGGRGREEGGDGDRSFDAFVLLKRLRVLPRNDGIAYVSDLDAFFSSLYEYYYLRGFGSVVGKGVVELASLSFTLWLSLVLFAYVDWDGLSQCSDERTCRESFLEGYVVRRPFASGSSLGNAWIVAYCLLFSTYGIFCLVQHGHAIVASLECKLFLEEVLGVSDRDLEVGRVEWGDVVERMSRAQREGKCRVAVLPGEARANGASADGARSGSAGGIASCASEPPEEEEEADGPTGHLAVAQRIMRRENYLVAFFNRGLLDLTIPDLPPRLWPLTALTNAPREDKSVFFSKSIEWSVYFCALNYMFNHSRKVRPAFYGDPTSLRRRFFLCGAAHAAFMPFLLFFVTLHFFMSNLYDWQSTKEYLGPREWSAVARWTFREFNELPHSFERRMEPSYKSAAAYLDMFGRPSPAKVALGRILVFVSGSLGTLLLAFAAMNDAILLHVKIGQWNLLWYAGVLGACFSVGKGLQPKADSPHFGHARRDLTSDMNLELEKLAAHTHYLPDAWRGKGWDDRTKKAFSPMFQFKANLFVMEVLSLMAAPLILCVSLPRCADKICKFVRDSKVEVPGVGDVVGYSTFDFDSFEDENWRGKGSSDHSSKWSIRDDRPKSRHGKMEKSFFNFKGVYPNWKMPTSGKNLVEKVETYRQQQDIALARERRLHIDAAAAQLETLRRLEMDREKRALAGLAGFVDDRHIRPVSGGPDSGGGDARGEHQSQTSEGLSDFGSFGSLPHDGVHHGHTHFEESAHSFAPPSNAFTHSSVLHRDNSDANNASPIAAMHSRLMANNSPTGHSSVLHYADAGLSMELRGLLNRSTLVDPSASQQSFTGSLVPMEDTTTSILDIRADQQTGITPKGMAIDKDQQKGDYKSQKGDQKSSLSCSAIDYRSAYTGLA